MARTVRPHSCRRCKSNVSPVSLWTHYGLLPRACSVCSKQFAAADNSNGINIGERNASQVHTESRESDLERKASRDTGRPVAISLWF